jgi:hypothetical protein
MPQETVEYFLGRILTDGGFRERFFAHPRVELGRLDLLEHERESLSKLERVRLLVELLAERLDPRIVRG